MRKFNFEKKEARWQKLPGKELFRQIVYYPRINYAFRNQPICTLDGNADTQDVSLKVYLL